jgi:hypothetical protein
MQEASYLLTPDPPGADDGHADGPLAEDAVLLKTWLQAAIGGRALPAVEGRFRTQELRALERDMRRLGTVLEIEREGLKASQKLSDSSRVLESDIAVFGDQMLGRLESLRLSIEQVSAEMPGVLSELASTHATSAAARQSTQQSNDSIAALDRSVRDVAAVAEAIAGVARQTRLLALNATIEAARAGEAGRGFAVVASEVKALSTVVEESTRSISTHVERIMATSRQTAVETASVTEALTRIDGSIDGLSRNTRTAAERMIAVGSSMSAEAAAIDRSIKAHLVKVTSAYRGTREEAIALLERADRALGELGQADALARFQEIGGGFVDRDLFIWAMDEEGILLANPHRCNQLGTNIAETMRDADGNLMVREMRDRLRTTDRIEIKYRFDNPVTKRPEPKTNIVRKRAGVIFGTGYFNQNSD